MDTDSHIYGLLGRVHVLMRRVLNRITDVEYMRSNADYAREIVRIAMATDNAELHELCAKLRLAMELDGPVVEAPKEKSFSFSFGARKEPPPEEGDERYIGSLR